MFIKRTYGGNEDSLPFHYVSSARIVVFWVSPEIMLCFPVGALG